MIANYSENNKKIHNIISNTAGTLQNPNDLQNADSVDLRLSAITEFPFSNVSDDFLEVVARKIKFKGSLKANNVIRLLDDENIKKLTTLCPLLKKVDLSKNLKITALTVKFLAMKCPQLTFLNCSTLSIMGNAFLPLIENNILLTDLIATEAQVDEDSLIDYLKINSELNYLALPVSSSKSVLKALMKNKLTKIKLSLNPSMTPSDLLEYFNNKPSLTNAVISTTCLEMTPDRIRNLQNACLKLQEVTLIISCEQLKNEESVWNEAFASLREAGIKLTII